MKIYTRTGDAGTTSLVSGARVSKLDPRVEAYGTVDELNSILGVALAAEPAPSVSLTIVEIQNLLFEAGADLATPEEKLSSPRITQDEIQSLEALMDKISEELEEIHSFHLPGGTPSAAQLHLARAVCRRAERGALAAVPSNGPHRSLLIWLNRLSDCLFLLARLENQKKKFQEILWVPKANKSTAEKKGN